MTWQAGVCPFYYSSHYTPTLTNGTQSLTAASANMSIVLGATGLGADATKVSVTVLDEKLGACPADVVAVNASQLEFKPGVQTYGQRQRLVVDADGLGDAMVTEDNGPLEPQIKVRALQSNFQ